MNPEEQHMSDPEFSRELMQRHRAQREEEGEAPSVVDTLLGDRKSAKKFRAFASLMLTAGPVLLWIFWAWSNSKNDVRYTKKDDHTEALNIIRQHTDSIQAIKERQAGFTEKLEAVQRSVTDGHARILEELRNIKK